VRRVLIPVLALMLSACAPEGTADLSPSTTAQESSGTAPTGSVTEIAPTTAGASPSTSAPGGAGTTPSASTSTCWSAPVDPADGGIVLADATDEFGLVEPLTGMMGHAAAWADVDGDLAVDLFVGTFANRPVEDYQVRGADGPGPDRVLLGSPGGFTDLGMDAELGRTSGAVFADLDLDGDVDLVISRNPRPGRERAEAPSTVYRNDGGSFVEVPDAGLDPVLGGRSIGVLDIDGDGLPDLILLEDKWTGGSTAVYRNLGDLRFADATAEFGFPDGVHGLGIATADINGDGLTDVVIGGSNRVFVGTGDGLREVPGVIPEWEVFGNEDDVAGVSIADVNGDGLPDLVLGHHYNSTLSRGTRVPVRLYLNRTTEPGAVPAFEDVTERAGLIGLPTKAPHVEFVDLDNDGLVDILTSASAADGTLPAVFRNTGIVDGVPVFEPPTGLGSPQYWVAMPTADVDRDGRIDMLGVEWEPSLPSPFFHNRSASGHWLQVSVDQTLGGGPGTVVAVYEQGGADDPDRLLGVREITLSQGYSAGNEALAHFGLGHVSTVDVVVTPPRGTEPIVLPSVGADQHLRLPHGC
jgi:enediyne biosynthesis protein E4